MRFLLALILAFLGESAALAVSGGGAGPAPAKESAAVLQQKCDSGNAVACANLGFRHLKGDGLAKDGAKAVAMFERACDRGDAIGCTSAGDLHFSGDGVPKNVSKAAALYLRGCDGGDGEACVALALSHGNGDGVPKSEAKTALYADRACTAKNQLGCAILGLAYAEGAEGYPKDIKRADDLLFNSCLKDAKFSERPDAASRVACPALAKLRGKPSCVSMNVANSPTGDVRQHCYDEKAGWVTTVRQTIVAVASPARTKLSANAGLLGSAIRQVDGIDLDDLPAISQLAAPLFDAKVPEEVRSNNMKKLCRLAEAGSHQAAGHCGTLQYLSKSYERAITSFRQCVSGVDDVTVSFSLKSLCYMSIGLIEIDSGYSLRSKARALAAFDECAKRGRQECIATAKGLRNQ